MKHRSSYWQLSPFLRAEWPLFLRGWFCILGYLIVTLTLPHLAGQVAQSMGDKDVEQVATWLGLGTLAFLVRSIFQYGENIWTIAASLKVVFHLRRSVYAHLQTLGLDYFEQAQTGDLTYRLTEDIDRIGEVVNKLSQQFLSCVLQLIAIPIYMLYLNWPLTLASFILAPLMGVLVGQFGEKLLVLSRRSQSQVSNLASLLTEVFGSIRVVQAFAAQNYEVKRFSDEAERNRKAKYQAERVKATQYPVVGFLEAVSIMLLFLVGGWQISLGDLTSAEFVSYLAAVALLLHPIELVTNQYNEFKQSQASVERVFELMHKAPTVQEKPSAIALPEITGKIDYQQIHFAYESERPVLRHFSLKIHPGEVVALVGPSGAGKSTIANLLPRFYDPQQGQILIDGINLQDVTLPSLRKQIGIVPQETALFSGTIAENIAYGQREPALSTIETAAQIANAHQFIIQLSQGYQTWVGEKGSTLSGGQRQRIAIARAILRDPRILILDEATSALDSESEALVQEALERAMENRTTLIIAHRLSTVYRADRILFLENGQVVESGNHTELVKKNGRYASFYSQQFKD